MHVISIVEHIASTTAIHTHPLSTLTLHPSCIGTLILHVSHLFAYIRSLFLSLHLHPPHACSQLGADADSARCDAEDVQTITAPADTQTFFGVGGRTNPYSNDQRCVWEVRPSDISTGGCISLVFTFFELENNEDKVMVYNMENNLLDTFTGEILCPKVVRYEGITQVRVVFMADNELHVKHETLQLGFKATYFDSSEDDTCYNDCSGHGTCESNGMCQCELGWIGGDCSIEAPLITNDNTQYLTDLCIGCWAYFTIECTDEMTIVLELVDTGTYVCM